MSVVINATKKNGARDWRMRIHVLGVCHFYNGKAAEFLSNYLSEARPGRGFQEEGNYKCKGLEAELLSIWGPGLCSRKRAK